jgi:hypothetical protein
MEMRNTPAYKQNMAEYDRLRKELQQYVVINPARPGDPDVPHGYVWLFRRK